MLCGRKTSIILTFDDSILSHFYYTLNRIDFSALFLKKNPKPKFLVPQNFIKKGSRNKFTLSKLS